MSQTYQSLDILAQGSRAALSAKIAEVCAALNAHEAALAGLGSSAFSLVNGQGTTINAGAPIAILNGQARLANAASQSLTPIGIAVGSAAPATNCSILPGGIVTLITAQWDAVTGQTGGLTAGALYYAAPSPGALSTSPPSANGHTVCALGRALSTTQLLVEIGTPVLL